MLFGPKPYDGKIGYHVLTPLKTLSGTILVNRGWVDEKDKDKLPIINKKEPLTATGVIRKPDWNKFTPNNNPESNIWTKLDIKQIGSAKNLEGLSHKILYLDKAIEEESSSIHLVHEKWYPRNKHRQYAIFWFSMAVIFLGFFVLYTRSAKRAV